MDVSSQKPIRLWPAALILGLASAIISVGRLWLANPEALTKVLWAEDGLFPICVNKAGFLACLFDPYAGYLHLLPRLSAGVIALFPVSTWPVVATFLAAVFAGLTTLFTFWWLRRYGFGVVASTAVALLPVITPIVGLESINVIACVYMLMLFLAMVMLAFPLQNFPLWPVAVFFVITSLTIPSMAILLVVLVFQIAVRQIAIRTGGILLLVTALGVVVHWLISQTAEKPRVLQTSVDTLLQWVQAVPTAILTFVPGLGLSPQTIFTNYQSRPSDLISWLVVGGLLVLGVSLVVRHSARNRGIGLLVLAGLALGALPSIVGFANNRYFVVPCLLWAAALVTALDPLLQRSRWWAVGLAGAVIAVVWWPAMPASAWRTTPAPSWPDEVTRVVAQCKTDPGLTERPIFTPFWPPNWGDGLAEPSHPSIPCVVAYKWN